MRSNLLIILLFNLLFSVALRPENNSEISYTHVLFEWDQIYNAMSYEIQISTDNEFANVLVSEIVPSLIYINKENLNWDSTYFWRIRAKYNENSFGEWQSVNSFQILDSITTPSITLFNENLYQEGITFLGSLDGNFSAAFDKDGNEIWNTQDNNIIIYNTNLKGELYGCYYDSQLEHSYPTVELNLDNEYIWEESNSEFSHHELLKLPDGNYMSIVETIDSGPIPPTGPWFEQCCNIMGGQCSNCYNDFFPWVGDKLVIWDKDTKESVWEWNVFDHYSKDDYDGVNYYDGIYGGSWETAFTLNRYDWTHINAISFSQADNAIYLSCRHLSRLTKIYFNFDNYDDPNNGTVIWNIGQDMPSGDVNCGHNLNFSWQHSVFLLDDGNIVTLDNGNLSTDFNTSLSYPISRAIEINPNETESGCDAEIVWEYSMPEELFGHASGGAQKLENGNYLISTVGDGGTTLEVSNDMEIVWEAKYNLNLGLIHRAYRAHSLYPVEASVVAPGLTSIAAPYSGNIGIYVPFLDSIRVSFDIYNNGSTSENFIYSFGSIDVNEWYPYSEKTITLDAGQKETVSFTGHPYLSDEGDPDINNVQFTIKSVNNSNINKTYNYTVYATLDDLSNDQYINDFKLISAYPNPFNPSAIIKLNLEKFSSNVSINAYDINGKLVESIYSGSLNSGEHTFNWKPADISSGKYFIRFESNKINDVIEIIYLK